MEKRVERETSLELPEELIEEILYYLPAKNLLRLKCVSKSWNSLISSNSFIKEHAKKSSTNGNLDRSKVMLNYDDSRKRAKYMRALCQPGILVSCPIQKFLHNEDPVAAALDSHHMKKLGYDIQIEDVRILGSCNGLILISINDWRYLFLWNPFTRKMRNIPHVSCFAGSEFSTWTAPPFTYSLGYDEYADDYKVVCIISDYAKPYHTHIYSSKNNTWKKIESFDKGDLLLNNSGKFVNGKLHWLAAQDDGVYEIFSLDLRKEKYEIVARPESFSKYVRPFFRNMGGYLGLITLSSSVDDINVWVMMKYGVRESWTKIWTFSYLEYSKTEICGVSPLCLKKNGDIIIAFENNVVVYNGRNELRKSRVEMLDGVIDSVVYVETLVSRFGDEELGQ
ncbi:hypothetical protein ABFS82_14G033500 [Erythranthe guttata]|uniref:F-box domain-containing protein n=1 Tax=Erythranthe guttata TaxID=4155 RepID=A0A022QYJ3_ERYGU|nr:PREDICTED: F-box/kelch-repeat protein At3g23880-like [Erythranthe guttata]EYU32644.1 hypothetical protein MIMGU_mgv1a018840mg [Erythranthe guttata]|eukprot:XP_012843212.1 PREDICTED: F-box/kelch-repeat protein At3g23880-like [Erythranthe guttata]